MARASTKAPGTAVVDWEKEMAAQAQLAADAQRASGGGGKFFSMKGGILSFDGNPMPGNRAAVIVIAATLENSYYPDPFVEGVPSSPRCFAFGQHESQLEPHVAVDGDPYFDRQNMECAGCPQNEWVSARTGRGKACSNVERLALIPCGAFKEKGSGRSKEILFEGPFEDEDHYAKAGTAFIKLPVMSVKNFASYVRELNANMQRPPHGVFTEMWVEPDPKSQFVVKFEVIDKVPAALLGTIMARHAKEQATIDFPYQPPLEADEAKPSASTNKLKGKAPLKKTAAKR